MTEGLSARQTQILKALIDEYIETAVAVGSEALEKKYNLGVSPATIRAEMAALTRLGYLRQPHTSAGRIPSPLGMKFYIDQLMEEKQMSITDEVKAKEDVWDSRGDLDDLLSEATHALAEYSNNLAITSLDDGKVWHSGYANVFENPEFSDMHICSNLFSLIEEASRIHELFFERVRSGSPIDIFFGEELGWSEPMPIGIVATHFSAGGKNGALGIIGPVRLRYQTVIPVLRYFKNLIEEVANK